MFWAIYSSQYFNSNVFSICSDVCVKVQVTLPWHSIGLSNVLYSRVLWYLSIFRKSVKKVQVSLKSGKNNGTLHADQYTFLIITWVAWKFLCLDHRRQHYRQDLFSPHADQYTFLIICPPVLLRIRNVSDKICREIQNTRFVFSNCYRGVRKIVCPSAWNSSAPTGRIYVKFDTRVFFFLRTVEKINP